MENSVTYVVEPHEAGVRLDKFLSLKAENLSRSRIQALLEQGHISNGAQVVQDASYKVKTGQEFCVFIPPIEATHMEGQDIPLDIVYEDADILVINKPPGLTVHPAPGHADSTLVNALIHHCGDSLSGIGGIARPGIVHRIDKDTSGLLVVAKHDAAHQHLSAQLSTRTLKRTYLALVWGIPNPAKGSIEGAIGRSPSNRQKMAVVQSGGKDAVTHYKIERVFHVNGLPFASLVECQLETGRTHQIRVHLTHRGYPLVGDPVYGGNASSKLAKLRKHMEPEAFAVVEHFKRQALHAYKLTLIHPMTGEVMDFEAPMPDDMQQLLSSLG